MYLCPLISYTQNVLSKNNQTISAVRKINIKAEISKYNYFRKNIMTNKRRMNRVNNFHEDPAKIRKERDVKMIFYNMRKSPSEKSPKKNPQSESRIKARVSQIK